MHRVEIGEVAWRGHRLAYEIRGEGERPIVLLHGLTLPREVNGPIATALAERGHRVILLELLGHGRSDPGYHATEHRMDLAAEQVVALLDHLGIEQAVVGGLSLGANVSLQTAVDHPERVRALVCEMPVLERGLVAATIVLFPLLLAFRYAPSLVQLASDLAERLPRSANETFNGLLGPRDVRGLAAVVHGYAAGPAAPSIHHRRRIRQATLVIGHRLDLMHPLDDAHALIEELPHARLLEARHILDLRLRPTHFTDDIADFLDEVWTDATAAHTRTGA